ncbi:hypothetical protein I4U23_014769 [Adineta vaga]|nr:hypothetical protein I4U23_014769 [Adineta vaga]
MSSIVNYLLFALVLLCTCGIFQEAVAHWRGGGWGGGWGRGGGWGGGWGRGGWGGGWGRGGWGRGGWGGWYYG